ncbi:MAG: phage tail protein [Rhizobiales bacterium]|jgi:hypothetical protein|nr:phage tail protein [Hyphomicrobiales bacterium]
MAVITKWANVAVSVQSALAATKTITAITKNTTGVVSSTAHGYSNGDYVLILAQGMYQVNYRVFRVSAVATDSFSLEGEDTTNYGTFVSGTAQKITFGTSLATLTSINASGGDFDFIDTTTIHDNIKTQVPGLPNPSNYTFDSFWDPSDAGLVALKSASDSQAQRAILFSFANGQKFTFNAYVGCSLSPTGSAQDLIKTTVVFTALGGPKAYSS